MKRRDFLKGVLGTVATVATVHLALPDDVEPSIIEIPNNRIYTREADCRMTYGDFEFWPVGCPDEMRFKNGLELFCYVRWSGSVKMFSESISEQLDAYLDPEKLESAFHGKPYRPKTKSITMSVQAAAFYLTLTPMRPSDVSESGNIYIPPGYMK
jgi:hypothetical protein